MTEASHHLQTFVDIMQALEEITDYSIADLYIGQLLDNQLTEKIELARGTSQKQKLRSKR